MTDVRVRPMKASDLPFVRRGLTETNWQDIPDDQKEVLSKEDADRRVLEDFDRYMKDEKFKFRVFVATSTDDAPVGYVSVGELMNPTEGLRFGGILDLWVSEEHRDKGVGSRLLDYALGYIKAQNHSHAGLMVSAFNLKAIHMYEKRGFKPDRINLVKRL